MIARLDPFAHVNILAPVAPRGNVVKAASQFNAQGAVSVSGTAGPSGGTAQKPVGTVCFGWGTKNDGEGAVQTAIKRFDGDRESVRRQAVVFALERVLAVVA